MLNSTVNVKAVDTEHNMVLIDWGWIKCWHSIPLAILENPDMPCEQIFEILERYRQYEPPKFSSPTNLLSLVQADEDTTV